MNNKCDFSGAGHGSELGYLFYRNYGMPAHNNLSAYPEELHVMSNMVKLWTNFAKYGYALLNKTGLETFDIHYNPIQPSLCFRGFMHYTKSVLDLKKTDFQEDCLYRLET